MIWQGKLTLSRKPRGFHVVTSEILTQLPQLPQNGMLQLFLQHTSAGLCINEAADPDVLSDFETIFNRMVPENQHGLRHTIEGPDDMPAHIKAAMTNISLLIPIMDGSLALGTWQGIFLCEFRNHASPRKIVASIF